MNAVLVILGLALLFYFMHRMHGQVGGCHDRHAHGEGGREARAPESTATTRAFFNTQRMLQQYAVMAYREAG